jgi:hypothetical protein
VLVKQRDIDWRTKYRDYYREAIYSQQPDPRHAV